MNKKAKKILIIAIYLIIFFGILLAIYFLLKPNPSCTDGKLNQNEKKVDCGGPCQACRKEIEAQDIEIKEKYVVYGGVDKYDVLVGFYNPNHDYGGSEFDYTITLENSTGNQIASKEGTGFILPRESKYYVQTNFEVSEKPANISVQVNDVSWEEFSGFEEPRLSIYNKNFLQASPENIYSEVYGLLRNESLYDFKSILVNVILRDSSGRPVAVNSTEMQTVHSQEERDFRLIWPYEFKGDVAEVEVDAEANVFDSENFLKKYSTEKEKFQSYTN